MADAAALAVAMQNIADALAALQIANAIQPHQAVHMLFDDATAFDMSSRAGSTAMLQASSELEEKWDGSINKLPSFLINLKKCSKAVKWNAPVPNGILQFTENGVSKNLFFDYHSMSLATIIAAATACTDPCAIQNSSALYSCLTKSIEGDLKTILLEQDGNFQDDEDGPTLFKHMVDMTIAASTQVSLQALHELQDLEPADFGFNISVVNTRATQLFTLATTGSCTLSDGECTQFLLIIYDRIKQPQVWSTICFANKTEAFDEGTLPGVTTNTMTQKLMNAAVLKHTKTNTEKSNAANWRSMSMEEDVLAMLVAAKSKKPAPKAATAIEEERSKLPPFARHFKTSQGDDAVKYKVGDSKLHGGKTWYFCDCPNHKNNIKWHVFPADECCTRKAWLATKSDGQGHSAVESDSSTDSSQILPIQASDITSLLANAFALASENSFACNMIAQALNAVNDV